MGEVGADSFVTSLSIGELASSLVSLSCNSMQNSSSQFTPSLSNTTPVYNHLPHTDSPINQSCQSSHSTTSESPQCTSQAAVNNCLSIYFLNARSLTNKFDFLWSLVYSSRPSVLAVAETWLSDLYFNSEILPSGYSILWKDCPSRGGGVLIATAFHIPSCLLYSQSDPDILTVKLYLPSPVIFCVIYIPPSSMIAPGHHCWTTLHTFSPLLIFLLLLATSIAQISTGHSSQPLPVSPLDFVI